MEVTCSICGHEMSGVMFTKESSAKNPRKCVASRGRSDRWGERVSERVRELDPLISIANF